MAKPYKLNSQIEQFIIAKKKEFPKTSCRSLVQLVKEGFGVDISKSSINSIIKENNLSNKVGRPNERAKKPAKPVMPAETVSKPVEMEQPVPAVAQNPFFVAVPEPPPVEQPPVPPQPDRRFEPVFEAVGFGQPTQEKTGSGGPPSEYKPPEPELVDFETARGQVALVDNGGAIFMLMADYKFGFTGLLAEKVAGSITALSKEKLRLLLQARIFGQLIKDESNLWKFLGKELINGDPQVWYERLAQLPFDSLAREFSGLGLSGKINDSNGLYKACLVFLNSQAQEAFLPSVYQLLDLPAMIERFYSLSARIKREDNSISVQFLYHPQTFRHVADIIWQEDFNTSVKNLNRERVFAPEGQLFCFEEVLSPRV